MKKYYLTVLTIFLCGIIAAQVEQKKLLTLPVKKFHNAIKAESKAFTFYSPSYEHFIDRSSIDYMQKSKNQKTWGWILTGAGVAIITVGLLTQDYVDAFSGVAEEENSSSPAVYIVGGACITGGIVLFAASSRNRKKAVNSSAILKMERSVVIQQNSTAINIYPAAGILISF